MPLAIGPGLFMVPGLICNACRLELADIFMLENVNKVQYLEVYLNF